MKNVITIAFQGSSPVCFNSGFIIMLHLDVSFQMYTVANDKEEEFKK